MANGFWGGWFKSTYFDVRTFNLMFPLHSNPACVPVMTNMSLWRSMPTSRKSGKLNILLSVREVEHSSFTPWSFLLPVVWQMKPQVSIKVCLIPHSEVGPPIVFHLVLVALPLDLLSPPLGHPMHQLWPCYISSHNPHRSGHLCFSSLNPVSLFITEPCLSVTFFHLIH